MGIEINSDINETVSKNAYRTAIQHVFVGNDDRFGSTWKRTRLRNLQLPDFMDLSLESNLIIHLLYFSFEEK